MGLESTWATIAAKSKKVKRCIVASGLRYYKRILRIYRNHSLGLWSCRNNMLYRGSKTDSL